MYRRLEAASRELDTLGLTHRSSYDVMLERLAGGSPVGPLRTLADVLEPANLRERTRTHKYTQQTPLDRLVDAVRPESAVAREFAGMVARMDRDGMRTWLTVWRDNDAQLESVLKKSPRLAEDAPLSRDLSRIGSIGLDALDYLDRGQHPPDAWLADRRAFLENAKKLRFELKLAVAAPVEELVDAAAR